MFKIEEGREILSYKYFVVALETSTFSLKRISAMKIMQYAVFLNLS